MKTKKEKKEEDVRGTQERINNAVQRARQFGKQARPQEGDFNRGVTI